MDILYRDFGAARYRSTDERFAAASSLSPHTQLFQPLSVLTPGVAMRRYQSTPENALSLNWYVKLDIDTARDHKGWDSVKVPAGETLDLYKGLPGWNRLLDVGYLVGCNSDDVGDVDISVVAYDDPATDIHAVAAGLDLTTPTDDAFAVSPATGGDYIQRETPYLLKVSLTPPYTDEAGNGVFVSGVGTACEQRACIRLVVHAHLRNMCFKESIRGCNLDDYGCNDCCEEEFVDPCAPVVAPPAGGGV